MKKLSWSILSCVAAIPAIAQVTTTHPPSAHTIRANQAVYQQLPFADTSDFANARKGFIASFPGGVINDSSKVNYSIEEFSFINGKSPESVNPSLWRQSQLNAMAGLFKVADNIYQVRGFDLANMSLIKGKTGWIIIDPLTVTQTAKAGMELVKKYIGNFPVKAVIITHSHIDHFGGMRAFVHEAAVKSGQVKIIVPEGFLDHSVSENVMAGNAMTRRSQYMYGNLLPKTPNGSLGSGLGTTTARGDVGILDGTDIVKAKEGETKIIDGVKIEFIYTPESEAPAEMMFYFPEFKAFMQAEDVNHTLHNLYTLRGAQVRNGQKWSMYIDKAIAKWGAQMQVSFGSHHWPTWGNKNIVGFLESQRDLYRFIHDQTLRLANEGYTPLEIADSLRLPAALDTVFWNRGYYGTVSHDVKAQYQLYFGWFDGNPANLNPLPPASGAIKYVEFMGGADKLITMAAQSYEKGEYRWVAEVVRHLVFAQPNNSVARNLLADAYEQLGYQAESGPWRNFYLTGAQELRVGKKPFTVAGASSPDMIKGMSSELFFNYLAMRYKGIDASNAKYNFNLQLTDTKEKVSLVVSNGTVHARIGRWIDPKYVTASITTTRMALVGLTTAGQQVTVDDLSAKGTLKATGDLNAFKQFLSQVENFDLWFNISEP